MNPELYAKFIELIAQGAYEGYCRAVGGKSAVTGDVLPPWFSLKAEVKRGWRGAAAGILEFLDPHPSHPSSRPVATGRLGDFPRRHCVDLMTPAELAIRAAIESVELVGADERLTDAVVLLGRAQERVADFFDKVPGRPSGVV